MALLSRHTARAAAAYSTPERGRTTARAWDIYDDDGYIRRPLSVYIYIMVCLCDRYTQAYVFTGNNETGTFHAVVGVCVYFKKFEIRVQCQFGARPNQNNSLASNIIHTHYLRLLMNLLAGARNSISPP